MWCSEIKCEISPQSEETGKPSLRKCHFKFKLKGSLYEGDSEISGLRDQLMVDEEKMCSWWSLKKKVRPEAKVW